MEEEFRPRYYRIGETIERIDTLPEPSGTFFVAVAGQKVLGELGEKLGFSQRNIEECSKIKGCRIEDFEQYLFIALAVPAKRESVGERAQVGLFLKKDTAVLCPVNQSGEGLIQTFQPATHGKQMTAERFLAALFDHILEGDVLYLEKLEEKVSRMEEQVLSGNLDGFQKRMLNIRKKLLYLYSYYEQLVTIGEKLGQNDADLFTDTRGIEAFRERAARLSGHAQILREYSMQVREMFQGEIDTRQNRIMKILTVVTTVFLPLTLIVGWYGMNFTNMPELKWSFGYPMVILVSVAVVIICILIFKKKKFL